jgi:hypothetical protein
MCKVEDLIKNLDSLAKYLNVNPTVIYNEGWLTRLLVYQSIEESIVLNGIDFSKLKNKWVSEAMIKSPFTGSALKAQKLNETHTHPDIILGDFKVDFQKNAAIEVMNLGAGQPGQLGIIEAKMGSNLGQKTTNANGYNQASRSIACLAYNVRNQLSCEIFFIVAAPQAKITKINAQILPTIIKNQINQRCLNTNNGKIPNKQNFYNIVHKCEIFSISFEDWIDAIKCVTARNAICKFYADCLKHNKI